MRSGLDGDNIFMTSVPQEKSLLMAWSPDISTPFAGNILASRVGEPWAGPDFSLSRQISIPKEEPLNAGSDAAAPDSRHVRLVSPRRLRALVALQNEENREHGRELSLLIACGRAQRRIGGGGQAQPPKASQGHHSFADGEGGEGAGNGLYAAHSTSRSALLQILESPWRSSSQSKRTAQGQAVDLSLCAVPKAGGMDASSMRAHDDATASAAQYGRYRSSSGAAALPPAGPGSPRSRAGGIVGLLSRAPNVRGLKEGPGSVRLPIYEARVPVYTNSGEFGDKSPPRARPVAQAAYQVAASPAPALSKPTISVLGRSSSVRAHVSALQDDEAGASEAASARPSRCRSDSRGAFAGTEGTEGGGKATSRGGSRSSSCAHVRVGSEEASRPSSRNAAVVVPKKQRGGRESETSMGAAGAGAAQKQDLGKEGVASAPSTPPSLLLLHPSSSVVFDDPPATDDNIGAWSTANGNQGDQVALVSDVKEGKKEKAVRKAHRADVLPGDVASSTVGGGRFGA
jgi:hypothetical protein